MKFLADENVERDVVLYLRTLNHDVFYASEADKRMTDSELLAIASKQKRILITNDKDFGELVFLQRLMSFGVILMRFEEESISVKTGVLEFLLNKYSGKIRNRFIVIDKERIRVRSLPVINRSMRRSK